MTEQQTLSSFELPQNLVATEPPELRGLSRSDVKLLVINRMTGQIQHSMFENLKNVLVRGDLLVFNSSRTIPALLSGSDAKSGKEVEVRLAEHLPDGSWLALLLANQVESYEGMRIEFGLGLSCTVLSRDDRILRLWKIRFSENGSKLMSLIYEVGRPIRYEYVPMHFTMDYYQNVYARKPGSSEMPSAGRAFSWQMLFDLEKRGIETTDIILHTGLSSYMNDEFDARHPVPEEEFTIEPKAARKISETRSKGSRVVAVGTTVVRALESAISQDGSVAPGHGYTRLHITQDHRLKFVDGLLTGMHEPKTSHLDLLRAFIPEQTLDKAYEEAVRLGYLWHEFGDLNLIA